MSGNYVEKQRDGSDLSMTVISNYQIIKKYFW